jgi:hypothetical protein
MTREEFEYMCKAPSFNTIVWNDTNAYKISGYRAGDDIRPEQSTFSLSPVDERDYDWKELNINNYKDFHVKLTGEMKALLYFSHNQNKNLFKRIGESL